jgi:hypothetical protein
MDAMDDLDVAADVARRRSLKPVWVTARLLKFFELEGRFPRHAGEPPPAAVACLAQQVKVDPGRVRQRLRVLGSHGRVSRAQIRTPLESS